MRRNDQIIILPVKPIPIGHDPPTTSTPIGGAQAGLPAPSAPVGDINAEAIESAPLDDDQSDVSPSEELASTAPSRRRFGLQTKAPKARGELIVGSTVAQGRPASVTGPNGISHPTPRRMGASTSNKANTPW